MFRFALPAVIDRFHEPLFISPELLWVALMLLVFLVVPSLLVWWDAQDIGMYRPWAWAFALAAAVGGGLVTDGLGFATGLLILVLYALLRRPSASPAGG